MKLAFVVNPFAGIGGAVALKGSDGAAVVEMALDRGAEPRAAQRTAIALQQLSHAASFGERHKLFTASGAMGADILQAEGFSAEVLYHGAERSTAKDTRHAIKRFIEYGVDLIVFAGGDGTARDVLDTIDASAGSEAVFIGIPTGVKIHSAVYAVTPREAGRLIDLIAAGEPMSVHDAMVMDLDEDAFRAGEVNARCYGYLPVPVDDTRMQLIKQGGLNHEELAVQDIASELIESMQEGVCYLIGSGSTTAEIMQQLGLQNTLLGIDVVLDKTLLASDVDEKTILELISDREARIVVTMIGGQGHVFGRGNQQLSARVIRSVGTDNIIIIATNEKLRSLDKRPMIADTGDVALDQQLSGLYSVITGYEQKTLYQLN